MARAAIPVPLVTTRGHGSARPIGEPLPVLWRLFLGQMELHVRAAEMSQSRLSQLRATAKRCAGLPDYPEPVHVREWYTNMQGASTTRRGELWNLHSMYAWAVSLNHAGINPCHKLKLPKTAKPKRHAIRDIYEKWPRFVACADALTAGKSRPLPGDVERARALLGVLRFGGLRIGEALGLFPGDVDTWCEPWVVQVRRQRSEHSLQCLPKLKTPTSERPIDVHPELRPLLAAAVSLGPGRAFVGRGGAAAAATPYLFPFKSSQMHRLLAALRAVAPEDFPENDGWHVFRHTIAVELRRYGVEVDVISKFLGHESIAYTQTYLRGMLSENQAAGIFSRIGSGPPPWALPNQEVGTASAPRQRVDALEQQATLSLGPLGVVKSAAKKGGSPPVEKVTAERAATRPAVERRRGSIPSVSEMPKPQRRTEVKRVSSQ